MPEDNKEQFKVEVDMKGTIAKFFRTDEPELSQEEAINLFGEENKNKKWGANSSSEDDSENMEEKEHLKRIKKELLASLNRVKQFEKEMFDEKEVRLPRKKDLKLEENYKSSVYKSFGDNSINNKDNDIELDKQQERE